MHFHLLANFLDLLAPGTFITSSIPGGGVASWEGTSMSTPHVAGAWAVLKQRSPEAEVTEILAALRDTGTLVDDGRSNGTVTDMRRINLDLAKLEKRVAGNEEWVASVNVFRRQVNTSLGELQATIRALQASP